jgi:SAM-dependent methyltransferase
MASSSSVVVRAALFFAALLGWGLAIAMAALGKLPWAAACAAIALCADAAGRAWSRRFPVAMPHFMRWVLLLPRGPQSPQALMRALRPRRGERVLEVGAGIGIHALPVASSLLPGGTLDVLDLQQAMLDDLRRRAARQDLANILPRQGDAQSLPYADRTFDAAYLVAVLGEIPDPEAALRELHRVLKPDGRLVVSEILLDPDFISLGALRQKAHDAGFVFSSAEGPRFAYSAVFQLAVSA